MAAQLRCRRFVLGEWLYRSQHSSNRLYCRRFICVESVGLASPIPYSLSSSPEYLQAKRWPTYNRIV